MSMVRILVVDDDPAARSGLELVLSAEGFAVMTAESGEEALGVVERERPDVVLTDLQMPGIDGIELCRRLHEIDAYVPVLVTTAKTDVSAAIESLRAGAEDYLTKPLDLDAVLWRVQQAIERRAARLEREQMRKQTEALYHEALAKTRAYETVLSAVAHDLRAPLGVISFQAQELQSLARGRNDGPLEAATESILRSCSRMNLLLKNVLDEARMRGGNVSLDRAEHQLSDVLQDIGDLRPLAVQKRVSLELTQPERDLSIVCDRVRVGQVLANLVSNAIRFSPRGQPVHVSAERVKGGVRFDVRDHGPGVSPEAQPRLFERFWQANEAKHGGVGLGLYIARSIVEAHGGRIWVESKPGEGSTFSFFLPDAISSPLPIEPDVAQARAAAKLVDARA